MTNIIYLYDYFTIIISDSLNVGEHQHLAHQITVSLDNQLLALSIEGVGLEKSIVSISPLVKHEFKNIHCRNMRILIDDEASKRESLILNCEQFESEFKKLNFENKDEITALLKVIGFFRDQNIDLRIKSVVSLIKEELHLDTLRISELAKQVNLSESRLLHLFKDEMGVPFRKYVLWQKVKRASALFESGKNLTTIAHEAGFSDSAHLSNFFKSTFGISPSSILSHSRFIQG